jgi:crotonobetainyl-CoA:carnitine CoA-transferase CaiB-like acyl-CoA transferase
VALSDVRVVEVAAGVASAYCASLFADLGADVIVATPLEESGSASEADFRSSGQLFGGALRLSLDRNKRWVQPRRVAEWADLIRWADLVIVGGRPEALFRLSGLDVLPEHLVVAAVSHFGQDGSRRRWSGSDLVDAAYGGGLQPNGEPGRAPLRAPAYVGDHEVGIGAAVAALTALIAARRDGTGQTVDVSAVDSWATIQTAVVMLEYIFQGRVTMRAGRRFGRRYPYEILACRDGDVRLICVVGREWRRALEMMGDPAWGRDPRYADRQQNQALYADELDALIGGWLSNLERSQVLERALQHAVPWAPVQTPEEVLDDRQLNHRGYVWRDNGHRTVGFPAILSRTPARFRRGALGAPDSALPPLEPRVPARRTPDNRPPLEGIRVIDFGWAWAGGSVGSVLADFGADVIKVESKRRLDPMRMDRPLREGESGVEQGGLHHNVNRNKRSIAVDISVQRGAEVVRALAARSDVLLVNLSPGTLEKHGLGYETLAADNPRLVFLSNTAVGRSGPLAAIRAYAPVITALAGVDALTGYADEQPLGLQQGLADPNAGLHGAFVILAAIIERETSGRGQFIDLSQLESMASLIRGHLLALQLGCPVGRPIGNRDPLMAPHGVYRARGEDRWVAIACPSDEAWQRLRGAMGDPEWARDRALDSLAGRLARQDLLDHEISSWCSALDRWDIAELLQRSEVPAAPLLDTADRFSDEHLWSRNVYANVEHPAVGSELIYGVPWKLSRTPGAVRTPAPLLGQHTREVLGQVLNMTDDAITELEEQGVLA